MQKKNALQSVTVVGLIITVLSLLNTKFGWGLGDELMQTIATMVGLTITLIGRLRQGDITLGMPTKAAAPLFLAVGLVGLAGCQTTKANDPTSQPVAQEAAASTYHFRQNAVGSDAVGSVESEATLERDGELANQDFVAEMVVRNPDGTVTLVNGQVVRETFRGRGIREFNYVVAGGIDKSIDATQSGEGTTDQGQTGGATSTRGDKTTSPTSNINPNVEVPANTPVPGGN